MEKEKAFLRFPRQEPRYRPVEERVHDFRPVELPLSEEEIRVQAARCMDCGTPFCHGAGSGCPLGNIIPEFNEQVFYGRWKEALNILLATNCFPEFTGRVCPAPCESACVLGLILSPVTICQVELAIIERAFADGTVPSGRPSVRKDEKVAVVGSGPAGLAAAQVLNSAGYRVTVYEKDPRPGGLLRYGIPDFKLEKRVIDRRISLMERAGVRFECGIEAGRDIPFRFLLESFDGVVLAAGARQPRDLRVPGRQLGGIHFAIHYLIQQNRLVAGDHLRGEEKIDAAGKKVVVIGGGDTGADCVGTAWRQGAQSVTQLEILPEPPASRADCTPWPLWPLMRRDSSSHQEGPTVRMWSVNTLAFIGKDDRVASLRCCQVEWKPEVAGGPPVPQPVPGSEFELAADLVLLALGFVGPGSASVRDEMHLECSQYGYPLRDERHMTSVPGVFVAGDMHRGPSLVVHALADGMKAARHVADFLREGRRGQPA
ncbi:MAG TPA: glutamate synthase subunit beta [Kiritimatiellae bacterium]|nr:glutamate synthase subunit beta [Kiritimatiellia bacterium]